MMITRKHLLLAIGATCLLTMFAITIVPIRSQTAGQYDPSLDITHDGSIDGRDVSQVARAFGTAGDPTLQVVTSANWTLNGYYTTVGWQSTWSFQANTAGFRTVTVTFYSNNNFGDCPYNVTVGFMLGSYRSAYQVDSFQAWSHANIITNPPYSGTWGGPPCTGKTYAVEGSVIWIYINNFNMNLGPPGDLGITMWLSIYMTA